MPLPSPSRTSLPAAGSTLTPAVLRGPEREAVVVGAHRLGLYLLVDDAVLPVVPSDAVALPTAVRLGARSSALPGSSGTGSPWGVEAGDRVTVGGGRVVLPGADVVVVRTWRPARVRRLAPGAACPGDRAAVAALLAAACADVEPWLAPATAAVLSRLECARGRGDERFRTHRDDDAGIGLIGRGRGLTPSGDDALAGALLVAHALRAPRALADAVRAHLGATTAVSAALLGAAGDGFAAHPVVALVDAVLVGHVGATTRALPDVLSLGHTSGRDLVCGVLTALRVLGGVASPADVDAGAPTPTGRSAA